MKHKYSDELFHLIRSMSQSEKRYFKIFSSRHVIGDSNKYVQLFDAIDKQKEYDEAALRKKFEGEKFVKQFHVAKNYLHKLLLESLTAYHGENTDEARLKKMLHEVEILFDRCLYKQCNKTLKKVFEIAESSELFSFTIEAIEWQRRIYRFDADLETLSLNLEPLYQKEQDALRKLHNLSEYNVIRHRLLAQYKKQAAPRTAKELEEYELIVDSPLMKDARRALSEKAKVIFYSSNYFFNTATGNLKKAYEYCKVVIELMEQQPQQLGHDRRDYMAFLDNFIQICLTLHKYDECEKAFAKIHSLEITTFHEEVGAFLHKRTWLRMCVERGEHEKGIAVVEEIGEGLKKYEEEISNYMKITFYSMITYLFMLDKQFKNALDWHNRLLNHPSIELYPAMHSVSKIRNLVIHYELGNLDLMEYLVKSTYRFLYKRNRLFKFETIMLNFIRTKLFKANTPEETLMAFRGLKAELEKIAEDPFESKVLNAFDFIAWLRSKIEKRPLAEILREKNEKGN